MGGTDELNNTKLTFTYRLNWNDAIATIGDAEHTARLNVWHVTDALGDLLRCVIQLLEGYEAAWCIWEDDPGEHKWIFVRHDDAVEIRILRFPTSFPGYCAPENWATPIFQTTCPLLKFAIKVRNEVRRLANDVGAKRYQNSLGHDFPQTSFDRLQRLIQERSATHSMSQQ